MKKRLFIGIQLALLAVIPAHAQNNYTNVSFTARQFTFQGGINLVNSNLTLGKSETTESYGTVAVTGNYSSTDSAINMSAFLDAGGTTVAGEGTHRILVNGNASGQTILSVTNNGGPGASTDLNSNTFNDANEGISLVQVSGSSTANAFVLKDGYTAVGAYQYRLYAYQPGQSDAAQRLVEASANGHWDYRLQNATAATGPTNPQPPTNPETPTNPSQPPVSPPPVNRPGLVPQVPSYLVHNSAMFAHGQQAITAMHQRQGELAGRHAHKDAKGDVYARVFGHDHDYASNLTAQQYGYDYQQSLHGLQVGGNWLALDGNGGNLRLGLVLGNSRSRTAPRETYAADSTVLESSVAKARSNSLAATMTWADVRGFYVDGVMGGIQHRTDITTPFREGDVARLESESIFVSIESGYDWKISDFVTLQPQLQLGWQKLDTDRITDVDGIVVDLGTPELLAWRAGVRALFTPKVGSDGSVLTQYIKLNYHDSNGTNQRALLSDDRFITGEYGRSAELGFGLSFSMKQNLSLHADMSWHKGMSDASREGLAGSAGVRWTF